MGSFTFVLVHGGWHGGWCYVRVADKLRRAGCRVFSPTLTGLGERSHLYSRSLRLSTHITDIINVIRWEQLERVVLVGHSYGGMVVTGVADIMPERIASLVYLDAFLPVNRQSLHDLVPAEAAEAQVLSATARDDLGIPPISAELFNVNEDDRLWVNSLCTPQPLGTFTERLNLAGGLEQIDERTYVLATGYSLAGEVFKSIYESVRGKPSWKTYELACGHDVMIDMPDEVAAILLNSRNEKKRGNAQNPAD